MDQGSENKTRYCQILLSTVLLVGTTAVFAFIGATGVLKIASTIILLCATQQINSPSFLFLLPPQAPSPAKAHIMPCTPAWSPVPPTTSGIPPPQWWTRNPVLQWDANLSERKSSRSTFHTTPSRTLCSTPRYPS